MLTLNQARDMVHALAVEKGWWEGERNKYDILNNFHGEISEVWEEYRKGKVFNEVYYNEGSLKPEGIPIEIVDLFIRFLDYAGHLNINLEVKDCSEDKSIDNKLEDVKKYMLENKEVYEVTNIFNFTKMIYALHDGIDRLSNGNPSQYDFLSYITIIFCFCAIFDIDLEKYTILKHEYNKTRSIRHGGKIA